MKHLLTLSLASLALTLSTPLAQAQQGPERISYQGRLTNSNGAPVGSTAPENRNIVFRIFDHPTTGTRKWTEKHTATVLNGDFSVILGAGVDLSPQESRPILSSILDGPERYIEISVEETPGVYQVISPRQQITASAFALRANVAQSVNQTTGESTFNTTNTHGNAYMNGTLVMNGSNQIFLGGGAGDANGALFSNSGGVALFGRGPSDAQRTVTVEAKGGTTFSGPIGFGSRLGQHISLWGDTYGIGIESNVQFYRTAGTHRWYVGGNSAGGGTRIAEINPGGFTLNSGVFTGNGSGLTNINPDALPREFNYNYLGINGANSLEFGRGTPKAAGNGFISYSGALHISGGGIQANYSDRRIELHSQGGLAVHGRTEVNGNLRVSGHTETFGPIYAKSDVVIEGTNRLNFTTPNREGQHINLWGTEYGIGIQGGTLYQRTGSTFKWFQGGSHNSNDAGIGGNEIANWNNDRCDFYRRVYISRHLNVSGSNLGNYGKISEFWNPSGSGAGFNGRNPFSTQYSIEAAASIVGTNFIATSDSRLKDIAGVSDSAADLDTINRLEITNYRMKDRTLDGGRTHKKLIAQQVESVFPQAISTKQGFIPDVFRMALAGGGFIRFKDSQNPHGLKTGDTVRLIQDGGELTSGITGITAEGFHIADKLKDGDVFVYGRQVNDLRLVDYEAIAMLNVSATQELHRTIVKQAAELKALHEENAALKAELARAQESNEGQDQRLAAIEKALAGSQGVTAGTPAPETITVSSRRPK